MTKVNDTPTSAVSGAETVPAVEGLADFLRTMATFATTKDTEEQRLRWATAIEALAAPHPSPLQTAGAAGPLGDPDVAASTVGGVEPSWPPRNAGELIACLQQHPADTPINGAYFVNFNDGRKECRISPLTISRERVDGIRIARGDKSVPYSLVVWSSQDERVATPVAAPAKQVVAPFSLTNPAGDSLAAVKAMQHAATLELEARVEGRIADAIRRAGLTLLKTSAGYEIRKLGPATAAAASPPPQVEQAAPPAPGVAMPEKLPGVAVALNMCRESSSEAKLPTPMCWDLALYVNKLEAVLADRLQRPAASGGDVAHAQEQGDGAFEAACDGKGYLKTNDLRRGWDMALAHLGKRLWTPQELDAAKKRAAEYSEWFIGKDAAPSAALEAVKGPVAVRVWTKGRKFTRGLYAWPVSDDMRECWALDGDEEELLYSHPSGALEALQNLVNAFHQGRAVPLNPASTGYVRSLVDAAEDALLQRPAASQEAAQAVEVLRELVEATDAYDAIPCPNYVTHDRGVAMARAKRCEDAMARRMAAWARARSVVAGLGDKNV